MAKPASDISIPWTLLLGWKLAGMNKTFEDLCYRRGVVETHLLMNVQAFMIHSDSGERRVNCEESVYLNRRNTLAGGGECSSKNNKTFVHYRRSSSKPGSSTIIEQKKSINLHCYFRYGIQSSYKPSNPRFSPQPKRWFQCYPAQSQSSKPFRLSPP